MNKKQMTKWVTALRSGKFNQARGMLRKFDDGRNITGHCCLGVLCEINKVDDDFIDSNETIASPVIMEKLGISSEEGTVHLEDGNGNPAVRPIKFRIGNETKEFNSLAMANDGGASFKQIARWIEKNYESL